MCTYIYRLTEEQRLQINKIISGESEEPAVVTLPVSIPTDASLMPRPPVPSDSQDTSIPSTGMHMIRLNDIESKICI